MKLVHRKIHDIPCSKNLTYEHTCECCQTICLFLKSGKLLYMSYDISHYLKIEQLPNNVHDQELSILWHETKQIQCIFENIF